MGEYTCMQPCRCARVVCMHDRGGGGSPLWPQRGSASVCNLQCSYVSFLKLCRLWLRYWTCYKEFSSQAFQWGMQLIFSDLWFCFILKINACTYTAAPCTCSFRHTIPWPWQETTYFHSSPVYGIIFLWFICNVCVAPYLYVLALLENLNLAIQVDLVEPVSHFLEAARENLTGYMDQGEDSHKAANFYCVPLQVGTHSHRSLLLVRYLWKVMLFFMYNLVYFLLQDFTPEEGRYDVIWIQWCIGQLPDDDFISFFNRAKVTWLIYFQSYSLFLCWVVLI